jgi:saccharopine dehydrogenase (NAD+, L-lysine forming)
MSKRVLIVGAGGVGRVVAFKCAQHRDVFGDIMLASRTVSKCDAIADAIHAAYGGKKLETARLDADNVSETIALIERYKPDLLVNVALPYQSTLGSGLITIVLRKKAFLRCWVAVLTRA